MKFIDAVLHVFYIQFASACILSESNSSKNDAFSHCRGYCKPLQYKLFQSTTLYVHLAVMQTKAFNVVNVLCLKIPFLLLCHLQIFHLVFTLLSKGRRKENKNASTNTTKGDTPLRSLSCPSASHPLPFSLLPPSTCLCSSGLTCLSVHSRGLVEINACYHLADVQKLGLKINRALLSRPPFRPWAFLLWPPCLWAGCTAVSLHSTLWPEWSSCWNIERTPLLCHFESLFDHPLPTCQSPELFRAQPDLEQQRPLPTTFPILCGMRALLTCACAVWAHAALKSLLSAPSVLSHLANSHASDCPPTML